MAEDGPGAAAGIMPGDRLVSINGDSIRHWFTFQTRVFTSANRTLELVVEREGVHQTLFVKPDAIPSVRGDIGEIRVSSGTQQSWGMLKKVASRHKPPSSRDIVESINGERLHSVPYFGSGVWHPSANWIDENIRHSMITLTSIESISACIRRGDEGLTVQLPVEWQVIAGVQKGSIAEEVGFRMRYAA